LKKKEAKNFYFPAGGRTVPPAQEVKVLWFFSSEKNVFPYGFQPGAVGIPGAELGRGLKSAGAGSISVPFT
jgi:hypothetical protein